MRVLWLTETYPPGRGGMAQSCDRIVANLRRAGIEVVVAHVGRRASDWTVEPRERGAEIRGPMDEDAGHAANRLWILVRELHARARFSHVVAFGGLFPLLAAPPIANWLPAPLITLLRGNDFDTGIFSIKRAEVVREALSRSTAVGAVTTEQVSKVRSLFPAVDVVWTPNGVDIRDWAVLPADQQRGQDWRRAHVIDGRRVWGLFGQLKQKKGIPFFLDALLASGRAREVHLLVVGDLDPSVAAWFETHASDVSCTVLPFRDRFDLLPLYAALDLLVLPSFYDGMPNVLLEATALGVGVLASDASGIVDVLGRQAPLLFAAGDRHACRRAIERALDPNEAIRISTARTEMQQRIAQRFDAGNETRRYVELLSRTKDAQRSRGVLE